MAIQLTDDGTMDTVLRCSECGEKMRYNYDPEPAMVGDDGTTQSYDDFVDWAIEDAEDDHDCPTRIRCDQCEMLSINGCACHETGCPNSRKVWNADIGEWQRDTSDDEGEAEEA